MPVGVSGQSRHAQMSLQAAAYTASGSNLSAATPASRLSDLAHPRRVVRSVDLTTMRLVLDLGVTAPTLQAISIVGTNCGRVLIEGSPTDTWGAPVFSADYAVDATDRDTGTRKRLIILTTSFTQRFMRLTPSLPDTGATAYEIGAVGLWPIVYTLARNPAVPYEKQLEDKAEKLDYDGGGEDFGAPSPVRCRIRFPVNVKREDVEGSEEWRMIARVPQDRVWLWYENADDLTQMYHVRRAASITITRDRDNVERFGGIELLECV